MDGLNVWAPTIVGTALLAYVWHTYFRIRREQAHDREQGEAAE